MSEEQDDLTLVYMYGFKNGELSMKAEIERLRAALREKDNIAYIIDSHGMTHQSFTIVYSAALEGEKTDD